MKGKTYKNRIVIPELIKKMKPQDTDKQNQSLNLQENINMKMKISQYLDDQEESNSKYQIEAPTNQSTCRGFQPQSLNEESSIKSVMISEVNRNKGEINRLEQLIKSQRMFINPDKWNSYMERAMGDPSFQKALNGFLYSYFIQNYN